MAIFNTRQELADRLSSMFAGRIDDAALDFIRDTLETYEHHSSGSGGISQAEHDRLMQEQDNAWRERYKNTFLSGNPDASLGGGKPTDKSRDDPADDVPGHREDNPASFDDLFSATV